MKTNRLFLLFFLIVIGGVFLYLPTSVKAVAWFDSDFSYRKSFSVYNSTTTQSNYQIEMNVYRTLGTDSATNVYLGTSTQADYDDIRFTNSTGTTTLDYYIASTTSDHAKVWVEFDSLPQTTTSTFYIYYGNNSATASSSFSDTFIAIGDFETGDYTGWTNVDSYEGWGSKGTYTANISNTNPPEGSYWAYMLASGGDTQASGKNKDLSALGINGWDNIRIMYYLNFIEYSYNPPGSAGNYVSMGVLKLIYDNGSTESVSYTIGNTHGTPLTDLTNNTFSAINPADLTSANVKNPAQNFQLSDIQVYTQEKYSSAGMYVDTIGIANYLASNTPVLSNWGSSEEPTYTVTYLSGEGGSITGSTTQVLLSGADGTAVTAVPSVGYSFNQWSNGRTSTTHIATSVSANITLTANFTANNYSLVYSAGTGGTISGNTSQTVAYGSNGTAVTAVASDGYQFFQWSDGSTVNPRIDTSVLANVAVSAVFGSIGGSNFVPPSLPKIVVPPMFSNNSINSQISNVNQMVISETGDFSGTSWEPYNESYKTINKKLYIKFRSPDGGESEVYEINSINNVTNSSSKSDSNCYEKKLIKYNNSPKIYLIENNKKCWIVDSETFDYYKYSWNDYMLVDSNVLFENGNDIIKPKIIENDEKYFFERDLKLGEEGEDVKKLQIFLNNNGYRLVSEGPGAVGFETEYFGNLTWLALIEFQKAKNINPAKGYFGPITRGVVNLY